MAVGKSAQGLYRYVLEMMGDGLVIQNEDGMLTYVNERLRNNLGYAEEEMLGNVLSDFLSPEENAVYLREMADIRQNIVHPFELRISNREGKMLYMLVSPRPIIDPDGRFRGSFAVFSDISAQKRKNTKYREIKRLEALAAFSTGMAHEFNNQLMKIRNYIALAKTKISDQKTLLKLGKAEIASEKARELTRKLISFPNQERPICKRCDIRDVISDTVMLGFADYSNRFELSIADDTAFVWVDEGFVCQALYQFFENSFEAMPATKGMIRLKIANELVCQPEYDGLLPGYYVKIMIMDDGEGIIDEAVKGHVFEPYYSTRGKERGFGLFLAKWLLEAVKGFAFLSIGEPGFIIYLPAAEQKLSLQDCPLPSSETTGVEAENLQTETAFLSPTSDSNSLVGAEELSLVESGLSDDAVTEKSPDDFCRIIVMDDDWEIRDVVGMMLESMGYKAKMVENGEMLLAELARFPEGQMPAVILDLTIREGMGGAETMQQIKSLYKGIKVFVSSGHATHPLVVDFARYGFCAAIAKPYDYDELEQILKQHLE